MTESLMARDRAEAKKKGWLTAGAWVGTGALFFYSFPKLGVLAVVGSLYLTFRWFMFRAKRGMRF
jgi:hypothetical protein